MSRIRVPVVLDTDIGDDIDDTWALAMALGSAEIDLRLVVTAAGNTPRRAALAAAVTEACGVSDLPIAIGLKTGDDEINQVQWLGDYRFEDYSGPRHEDGIAQTLAYLRAIGDNATLLAIGPLTNIAQVVRQAPGLVEQTRLVAMAGSVRTAIAPGSPPAPEWNVVCDIPAAQTVFSAPWRELVLAPLDICAPVVLDGEDYHAVEQSASPRARAVVENYRGWSMYADHPQGQSSILFDTVAAYLTFDDQLIEMETLSLVVDDEGYTREADGGRPVRCALRWRDLNAFKQLLVQSLSR